MKSSYTGDFPIEMGGEQFTLRFDYAALARLRTEHEKDVLQTLFSDADPAIVASVIAIGLAHHHPHITAEKVFELSPFIYPAWQALDAAIAYLYFGPKGVEEAEKNPDAVKKNPKKQNLFQKLITSLNRSK